MVVAPDGFRDEEYLEPRQALEAEGAAVKVASLRAGPPKFCETKLRRAGEAHGVNGAIAPIDLLITEVKQADFDAIIFIGGQGMAPLVNDERLTSLAQQFYNAGKITAAICIAPMVLAHAGLLKGEKATVWQGARADLVKAGAIYTGNEVEVDGKIITANGPAAARKFGEAIAQLLNQ